MNRYFFSYELPGIFSKFPRRLLPYIQLSRPYHFAGGVIPCLMGFHFASVQYDVLKWYILFIIGSFAILGAGATLNDIIDEKIENNNIPATGIYFLLKNKYNYKGKYGIVNKYKISSNQLFNNNHCLIFIHIIIHVIKQYYALYYTSALLPY